MLESHILNSRIKNIAMDLKPQDLLVMLKAAAHPQRRWTYAALGEALLMTASQVHASVKRAVTAGLAAEHGRGEWEPILPALLEFAVHGARYAYAAVPGPVKRGVPTSFGVAPLSEQISAPPGEVPVWADPAGTVRGPSLSPLYRSAPKAALADPALHRLLALLDALRSGRTRERALAAALLEHELRNDAGQ